MRCLAWRTEARGIKREGALTRQSHSPHSFTMTTVGIDLSSQGKNTASCVIDWSDTTNVRVEPPEVNCDDAALHRLIENHTVVGIDAPFGWPRRFTEAVANWTSIRWEDKDFQQNLRYRVTDFKTHELIEAWPLSVSTDRISLPAMRAMALLAKHNVTDKSGDGRFYEVYPIGSLRAWKMNFPKYKQGGKTTRQQALEGRQAILAELRKVIPTIPAEYAASDHALDALIASLSARAAALGHTVEATAATQAVARVEGWIHLPKNEGLTGAEALRKSVLG